MGFIAEEFGEPLYLEEEKEPTKLIIISCEGENTEPEYFETIKEKLADHIPVLLEITIASRSNLGSEPQKIVSNLKDYIKDKYDYKTENDEMWVVLDREKVPERRTQILEIIPECTINNFNIAITNPLFEFWLLLHIVDISTYDRTILFENNWVNENRRYIDKELSEKLPNGYNKKKGKFNKNIVTIDNILRALEQEKLFENDLEKIIDNLGSNIGGLIGKILYDFTTPQPSQTSP